jgi:hypothetical protein
LCERRAFLLNELAKTGFIDSVLVNRMAGSQTITRAACAHGLHRKFLALEAPAPGSMVPLASTNAQLLGIGRKPDPTDLPPPVNKVPRLKEGKGAS